jgi:alpha-glucosidase
MHRNIYLAGKNIFLSAICLFLTSVQIFFKQSFFQMKNLVIIFLFSTFMLTVSCQTEMKKWELSSPDGNLTLRLIHQKSGKEDSSLRYEVLAGETSVIFLSELGLILDSDTLAGNLEFLSGEKTTDINDSYDLLTGKQLHIQQAGRGKTVVFRDQDNRQLAIDLRVYNDGVAFRYRLLAGGEEESLKITGELTAFNIGESGNVWIHPYDTITKYTPAYETYYSNGIPVGTHSPGRQGWAFPALFETPDRWILLTESNLGDNFYGAHLQPAADGGIYRIRLPETDEAMETGPSEPTGSAPWIMPWRVIITGTELGTIVESNLVTTLAEPSTVEDVRWIKPGRASWSWWSDHDSPQDYNELVSFIDLAAEMGWEFSLVDANWNLMKNGDLEKLVEYANEKGVGILVWYNSGGPHNEVGEQLRDAMHLRERRREEFKKLQTWGVKGVKIDFFQSDKPHIIKQYHEILQDAADFNILCNFHGCTLPRGWRRTYPHLVSMEAVMGAECYSFDRSYPEAAPWHNTILPFTRNVVGPMDYTPVAFSDQTYPHITTNGHELALAVVFESGIIHFADKVDAYLGAPDYVKTFLSTVPAAWDQSRYLAGYPGKFSVIARKKDQTWYIGGINGQDEDQQVVLDAPFLSKERYMMEIIQDGEKERTFRYAKKPWKSGDRPELTMRPNGGFVVVLKPV